VKEKKKKNPYEKKTGQTTSTAARKESQEDRCRIGEDIQRLRNASITGRHCFLARFVIFY